MDVKLYVGNLPYSATEAELRELFEKAGTVASVSIMTDRNTGRSRGFAFVEMSSQAEAEEAIKLLNDADMNGRALKVNIARPREDRGPRSGQGGGGRKGDRRREYNDNRDRY
jgi:RNA recognition motif-containing protein